MKTVIPQANANLSFIKYLLKATRKDNIIMSIEILGVFNIGRN